MAFQGAQNQPDLVGLALNLMQMRRDRELAERKMALEEGRLRFDQQQSAIQAARDAEDWRLTKLEREAALKEQGVSFAGAQDKLEQGLGGQLLGIVNDPMATPADRHSAARRFDLFVQQQASPDVGRAPNLVGSNAGAGLASIGSAERTESRIKDEDARRSENSQVSVYERQRRIDQRMAEKAAAIEDNAVRAGKWTGKDLDARAAVEEKRLAFAPETTRMWNQLDNLDPTNPNDILVLTYMAQKSIDEGGVVRNEDVNTWRAQGFSGFDAALAQAQSFYDKNKRYPDGFGQNLKRTVAGMLEGFDQKVVDLDAEFRATAERNGWSPEMTARADAYPLQKAQARERIAAREAASSDGPPTDFEYKRAERVLRRNPKFRSGEIPVAELNAQVRRMRSESMPTQGPAGQPTPRRSYPGGGR